MLPEPTDAALKHQHQLCQVAIIPCCGIQEQLSLAVKASSFCAHCLRLSHTKYLNQSPYIPPSWYLNKALFLHDLHPSDAKRKNNHD